jgi:hypothetical protein
MSTPGSARGDIATRWVELIVALLFVLCGVIAIVDSLRVGITWAEDGPRAGYFPFYIGCLLVPAGSSPRRRCCVGESSPAIRSSRASG